MKIIIKVKIQDKNNKTTPTDSSLSDGDLDGEDTDRLDFHQVAGTELHLNENGETLNADRVIEEIDEILQVSNLIFFLIFNFKGWRFYAPIFGHTTLNTGILRFHVLLNAFAECLSRCRAGLWGFETTGHCDNINGRFAN